MTLDEHLNRMRAEGSRAAQRDFWRAVYAELWHFYRRGSDRVAREELASRAMVVVVRKLHKFKPRESDSFTRWVRAIAARERRKFEREAIRATARRETLLAWAALLRTSPLTWLLRQVQHGFVQRLIATLSTRHREALQHEDARSLADARGIGTGAARMRRRRALQRLADLLATPSVSPSTSRPTSA
jgi:hypothetical protein